MQNTPGTSACVCVGAYMPFVFLYTLLQVFFCYLSSREGGLDPKSKVCCLLLCRLKNVERTVCNATKNPVWVLVVVDGGPL